MSQGENYPTCSKCKRVRYPAELYRHFGGCSCKDGPYRTSAIVPVKEGKPGPKTGLIRAPKPIPPHVCSPPGKLLLLFYRLTFRAIHPKTVWRCKCGHVYIYERERHYEPKSLTWVDAENSSWVRNNLGGNVGVGVDLWVNQGGAK